jgi:hypothetical protein
MYKNTPFTRLVLWLNAIGLIVVLTVNYLANALPINGMNTGELSALYPNDFVPAGFTFAIWGIIFLALIGFVVFSFVQYRKPEGAPFLERMGLLFFFSCILNAGWIFMWHYKYVIISMLIMFLLLYVLLKIYQTMGIGLVRMPKQYTWFFHVPMSIYLGWISVATVANVTALLVKIKWGGFGLDGSVWASAMIVVLTAITFLMIKNRGDIYFALVALWAFFGILSRESNATYTDYILMVCMILIAGYVIRSVIKKGAYGLSQTPRRE